MENMLLESQMDRDIGEIAAMYRCQLYISYIIQTHTFTQLQTEAQEYTQKFEKQKFTL